MNNQQSFEKYSIHSIGGFIVPKEYIAGLPLIAIEKILGYRKDRLSEGAIFYQLIFTPTANELEYFGDTRSAEHRFEENRNKEISRSDLSNAAYYYIQPTTKLIKVKPIKDFDRSLPDDENFPPGNGAMQYKLKILSLASIIDVIKDYPFGVFN
jgi:hypothetical protein